MAQSGHPHRLNRCPLSGVKQTSCGRETIFAFDPKPDIRRQILLGRTTLLKFRVTHDYFGTRPFIAFARAP
jgi:hypothetical protein